MRLEGLHRRNMSQLLIFDARLRIMAGENGASIAHAVQQLNDLAEKHDDIVVTPVERLRAALGELPFTKIGFVGSFRETG